MSSTMRKNIPERTIGVKQTFQRCGRSSWYDEGVHPKQANSDRYLGILALISTNACLL
jgi:hypothetical protein